jgi:SRSO17 transposase
MPPLSSGGKYFFAPGTEVSLPIRLFYSFFAVIFALRAKSVERMAAITAPERAAAQHQSLLYFIGEGRWSNEKVLAKVRELVLPKLERHGPIEASIINDTSFSKKGHHSVGMARQYAVSLASRTIASPIMMRACRWPIG